MNDNVRSKRCIVKDQFLDRSSYVDNITKFFYQFSRLKQKNTMYYVKHRHNKKLYQFVIFHNKTFKEFIMSECAQNGKEVPEKHFEVNYVQRSK